MTATLKDFPREILQPYNVAALHPDDFILDLIDSKPPLMLTCFKEDRTHFRNPPYMVEEYLENLPRQGLSKTVAYLSEYRHLI